MPVGGEVEEGGVLSGAEITWCEMSVFILA